MVRDDSMSGFLCFEHHLIVLKCHLIEEDMMMDAAQTVSPAHPPEELTELGKCLMKQEVSIT